ncbi:MAG: hypothetical protein IPP19_03590 [Verrucomicrobia bacterium]|nr:hypothetical protein [Verrucomicrobiota bacterium]
MTFQGALRQVIAAQRRAARDAERRQKQHARALKLQAKADELERAAAEVEEFEERVQQLTSIHQSVGESIDWAELREKSEPAAPQKLDRWEKAAIAARDNFKPSLFQRLFGSEQKVRSKLDQKISTGKDRDEVSFQGALKLYQQQLEQWQESTKLAAGVLDRVTAAYKQALDELEPLSEIQEIGCVCDLSFPDGYTGEVNLSIEGEKVVPRESKSLTRTGKLSVKPLPQAKFYELYQDYVCGCALRTGRELFSFLPLTRVIVNIKAALLDSATGHLREQTILSVGMPRATLEGMNFAAADPSDAMALFPHRMGFKRSQGFSPVKPLSPSEYPKI